MDSEKYTIKANGEFWDVIRTKDKKGDVSETISVVKKNIITLPIRILIATRLKGNSHNPINFHAIGIGNPSWDSSPVPPTENDYPLVDEVYRKPPTEIVWIDPGTQQPIGSPTRIIRVKTTFLYSDMNPAGVYIREQGLFGGSATSTLNSGEMVDNIRHVKIWKDENVELDRYIKLTFE